MDRTRRRMIRTRVTFPTKYPQLTGTLRWTTPSGRECTTEPARYPI